MTSPSGCCFTARKAARCRDRETERRRDRETESRVAVLPSSVSPSLRLSVSPSLRLPVSQSLFLSARLAFSANSNSIRAMLSIKTWLFIALGGFAAFYLITWLSAIRRKQDGESIAPGPIRAGIGFVTNFFDTLGIGSFAPTTSFFKVMKLVKDALIPGTLNVGHTAPTIVQVVIDVPIVKVV